MASSFNEKLELAASFALVAISIYAISYVSIYIAKFSDGITVIWPNEGITLALMLGRFRSRPIAILLVSELACLLSDVPIEADVVFPLSMVFTRTLTTWLVYRVVKQHFNASKVSNSKGLVIFIGASSVASLIIGLVFTVVGHLRYGTSLFAYLFTGTAMQAVGCAVLTPLLLILSARNQAPERADGHWLRTVAIVGTFSLTVLAVFVQSRYPLLYIVPLGFMVVAYTVDLQAVGVAVLLTVVIAITITLFGYGPLQLVSGGMPEHIKALQAFIAIMTATTLPIAALMAEHARLKESLIASRIEAEAANRAKSVFLATISHEIRTPLNGVLGMAQIMSMDELSDRQRERVDVVRNSGEALLSLLNDVLDLSKIEAGKMTFEEIQFDLSAVLHDVARTFESLAMEKAVALVLDVEAASGLYLGDPLRIRQIIFNLLSNALKFTEAGEIRLSGRRKADGLLLAVSDTGIGIPADKLSGLFSKFNQVDESTTRRFGGTGLGLSICHELAALMGGAIEVESVDGQGSTFTLSLRLPRLSDAAIVDVKPNSVEAVWAGDGLRVLAAEDNATNQLILRTLLELSEVHVTIVDDGAQAVEAWEASNWDLILMDVQMPVMDGPTATKAIRKLEAQTGRGRTPIVALTANIMDHQVQNYLQAGMDGHLAKPIQLDALLNTLTLYADCPEPCDALGADIVARKA